MSGSKRFPSARPTPGPARGSKGTPRPRFGDFLDPRNPWLLPGLLVLASRAVLWSMIPFASEDAYITFRYARNLALGHGLVFNPGERVFGFSSPLWTCWMGLGHFFQIPLVAWARVSSLGADFLVLVCMGTLLRRHASNTAAWCFAVFFAAWPYCAAVSGSGMETTAMLALVTLAAWWIDRGSPWAGPGVAAVALIRPEGLAAAMVLALWSRGRDRWVAAALVSGAVLALGLYFGSPIPQSVLAKSQLYGTPGPWAGRFWWDWVSPFVFGQFPRLSEPNHMFLISLVATPAAALGAVALWRVRRSALAAAVGSCLVVWLGYAVLGVAYFWWYMLIPIASFVVLAAMGLPRLTRGPALYISLSLLLAGVWTLVPKLYKGRASAEYHGFARVAGFLKAHATPGDRALLEPIGMIGFGAPLFILDEMGLVSPQVARRRLEGPGWYTDVVDREGPEWLVVRRGLLSDGRAFAGAGAPFRSLSERDSLLARFSVSHADTAPGDQALVVLRRTR